MLSNGKFDRMNRTRLGALALMTLTLTYTMMLGGGIYEQLNITHKIASAPPHSFAMMQGPYGFHPIRFWVIFRPVTILLFLITLALLWKSDARKRVVSAFAIDVLITLATYGYFAPETGALTEVPFAETIDTALQQRAQRWETLNWARVAAFFAGCWLLLTAVSKSRLFRA